MKEFKERLTSKEWGKIYNLDIINQVVEGLQHNQLSFQTLEMFKLSKEEDKVLEIGCGSGETSVYLAQNNRKVTALDFSEEALACVEGVAEKCGVHVQSVFADATKELPFDKNSFDIIFQAGLLEHFEKNMRIQLLRSWAKVGKVMVSIIPNAASVSYRFGKAMMENAGTWNYGLELPQYTLMDEFQEAGILVTQEYTIGEKHALEFLPPRHYLRKALERFLKENPCEDNCRQGYLLVTVGKISCD